MTNISLTAPATIAVIGAGTMGAGIAQVAAAAGHAVKLLDVREGAAVVLAGLVTKGRMSEEERAAILARIVPVAALSALADAALAVEVIVEKLEAKQQLMRELEQHVSPHAILATNTSSISVTAIANGMQHPQRVVGMHFFNPVPLMKLVEVVWGAETDSTVAEAVFALAGKWGKTAVHAKSTPGFIVNRIARPFYAEALQLLQEQAGTPAALDRAMKSAGFRMGPCELMDLIGHDINYAVTTSVFEANYGDKRYQPSLVQKALLDGGRLGRKAGKGFYVGAPVALADRVAEAAPASITVCGAQALAQGPQVVGIADHDLAQRQRVADLDAGSRIRLIAAKRHRDECLHEYMSVDQYTEPVDQSQRRIHFECLRHLVCLVCYFTHVLPRLASAAASPRAARTQS